MILASWYDLVRLFIVGSLGYLSLLLFLRIFGNRTLAKMNAFDLVVTVALGSTLATLLLSKTVSLVEGVAGLFLLIAWQYIIAWLAVRSKWVKQMIKSDPALLFYDGHYLDSSMKAHRVTEEDVRSAIREAGNDRVEDVTAVILETEGSLTVVQQSGDGKASALVDVADQMR